MRKLGWIGLDIDGTITSNKYVVPKKVILYLQTLSKAGWQIVILTGRSFSFASQAVSAFEFPFIFCAQNGSIAFEMPSKKILARNYMTADLIPIVEKAYANFEGDFLVYSGVEKGDFCYWRPQKFNDEQLAYLEDLKSRQEQNWHALDSFSPIHIQEFPYIKGFGKKDEMEAIAAKLIQENLFEITLISDPFTEGYFVLQVTKKGVNKGQILKKLWSEAKQNVPIIAAGDDYNDLSLLEVADERIVMPTAPDKLKEKATIIAPPVEDLGILTALDLAISKFSL